MDDQEKLELLEELKESITPRERPSGSVTVKEFQEAAGISNCMARGELNQRVKDGTMECARIIEGGKRVTVYWRKK